MSIQSENTTLCQRRRRLLGMEKSIRVILLCLTVVNELNMIYKRKFTPINIFNFSQSIDLIVSNLQN